MSEPGREEAERDPGRVEQDARLVLRLVRDKDGAGFDGYGYTGVE